MAVTTPPVCSSLADSDESRRLLRHHLHRWCGGQLRLQLRDRAARGDEGSADGDGRRPDPGVRGTEPGSDRDHHRLQERRGPVGAADPAGVRDRGERGEHRCGPYAITCSGGTATNYGSTRTSMVTCVVTQRVDDDVGRTDERDEPVDVRPVGHVHGDRRGGRTEHGHDRPARSSSRTERANLGSPVPLVGGAASVSTSTLSVSDALHHRRVQSRRPTSRRARSSRTVAHRERGGDDADDHVGQPRPERRGLSCTR